MLFTEELERNKFGSTVVHSLISPQKVSDLVEVLSSRMRLRTEGRLWMGAHMRRGDCKDPYMRTSSSRAALTLSLKKQSYSLGGRWKWILRITSSA